MPDTFFEEKKTALQQNGFCHKIRVSKLGFLKKEFLKSVKQMQSSYLLNLVAVNGKYT